MKEINEQQEYINLKEASIIFGLDSRTMKKIWLSTEELHFTRVGRQLIMKKADLVQYFANKYIIKYKK